MMNQNTKGNNISIFTHSFHKLIEAISVIIAVIFCMWLLTACKKKDNDLVTPAGWDAESETVINYRKLKYKTFVSKPANDNRGFIWSFCQEYPIETSKLRPEEKIDLDSMIITLTDTLIEDGWGKGTFHTNVRGKVKAYFVPKKLAVTPWQTTELYINTITSDGTITAYCHPGDNYAFNISNTSVYTNMIRAGNNLRGFNYKIINKY